MNEHEGFGSMTHGDPSSAFLGAAFEQWGLPWPRKPLSGKPGTTKIGKVSHKSRGTRTVHAKKRHT